MGDVSAALPVVHDAPLGVEDLHATFSVRTATVSHIPRGLELAVRDAWLAEVRAVLATPSSEAAVARLLLFPLCVLTPFLPTNAGQRRGGKRCFLQALQIRQYLQLWQEEGGARSLLTLLAVHRAAVMTRAARRWPARDLARGGGATGRQDAEVALQSRRLASHGRYSAAVAALVSSGVVPFSLQALGALQELHPQAPLPRRAAPPPLPLPLHVTPELVALAIRSFPSGSGPGRDGFRPGFLQDMLRGAAAPVASETLAIMAALVSLLLADGLPPSLAPFIHGAHLTALRKESGGLRPIAVGLSLRRLAAKVGWRLVQSDVVAHLQPVQLGVGVPRGAEAIIHAVDRLVRGADATCDGLVAQLDLSNAFNSVSRAAVLTEVEAVCPALYPWVASSLCCRPRLYFGDQVVLSSAGVQQGDPLGPMLFALALQPLLLRISALPGLRLSAWFLDDGTLAGSATAVIQGLKLVQTAGPTLGLHLNPAKSLAWWPYSTLPPRSRADLVELEIPLSICRDGGVEVLGSPVSLSTAFASAVVMARADRACTALKRLDLLADDPQVQLLLLRSCLGGTRMLYSARTVPPSAGQLAFAAFDMALEASLQAIVGWPDRLPSTARELAALPLRLGGLGLLRAGDLAAFAFAASRLDTEPLQLALFAAASPSAPPVDEALFLAAVSSPDSVQPFLFHRMYPTRYPDPPPPIAQFPRQCDQEPPTPSAVAAAASTSAPRAPAATRSLQSLLAERFFGSASGSLAARCCVAAGDRFLPFHAALGVRGAFQWLLAVPSPRLQQCLPGASFRCLLHWRLGLPLGGAACAVCGVRQDEYGDHAVNCMHRSGSCGFIRRHSILQHTLAAVLQEAGVAHEVEPRGFLIPRVRAVEGQQVLQDRFTRPADLLLLDWEGGRHWAVDVTCTSLARDRPDPFGPLCRAEAEKVQKHAAGCAQAGMTFLPFATTTLGGFGAPAWELVSAVAARFALRRRVPVADARSWIRRRLSMAVMRGVAAQLLARAGKAFAGGVSFLAARRVLCRAGARPVPVVGVADDVEDCSDPDFVAH